MTDEEKLQKKHEVMTTSPVKKLILKLAIPTILSMLVSTFYNVADTFFVGKLGNDSVTSAVGIVFSLMAIIQAVGFFFGHGSGNYISRELGKKNTSQAEEMASIGFFSALTAGILITLLGLILLEPLARMLGATDTVLPFAKQYMLYILIGAPYMTAQLVLNNQLRFQGNAFFAMVGIVSGAIINIVLDPLFIFVFDLGVSGAAIATIISQFISFIILLIGVQKSDSLKISFRKAKFSLFYFKQILNGGSPSLFRQGLASVASICLSHIAGGYNDSVLAAFTVVQKIMMFASSALIGFGQGFQPVCGYNWGAGNYKRVKDSFWFCIRVSAVFLFIVSGICYLFAGNIVALFRDSDTVITVGTRILRAQLISFPFMSWVVLSNMMLQNIGMVYKASVLAMSRQGITFIPVLFILPAIWGLDGLIWTQSVADLLAFCIALPIQISVLSLIEKKLKENS